MGNFLCRLSGLPSMGEGYNLSDDDKKASLIQLRDNFIKNACVTKIEGETCFGLVSQNWQPEHSDEMKQFFSSALDDDASLISSIYVWEKHIKTGNTHVTVKILTDQSQDPMTRGIREVKGKALELTYFCDQYSPEIFKNKGWSGSWYDGKLCGRITKESS